MRFLLVLLLAACGASQGAAAAKKNKPGAITGIAHDKNSGESLVYAEVEVAGRTVTSTKDGTYLIDPLPPGRYTLHATYAGQPVTVNNIEVSPGMATYVDVTFTLGDVTPLTTDWGDAREAEIQHFTTKVPRIEGTVGDANTRARVAGAVVTAARGVDDETLQTVTDDNGRYRFDNVDPGTYAISAYYSVGGRAQIEVRRSDVTIKIGEGVLVPLWIELSRQ